MSYEPGQPVYMYSEVLGWIPGTVMGRGVDSEGKPVWNITARVGEDLRLYKRFEHAVHSEEEHVAWMLTQ